MNCFCFVHGHLHIDIDLGKPHLPVFNNVHTRILALVHLIECNDLEFMTFQFSHHPFHGQSKLSDLPVRGLLQRLKLILELGDIVVR